MESVASSSICRACRVRLLKPSPARGFSTSSTRLYIPPESPAFIDIPKSHQALRDSRPRPKGLLPVPRELFRNSRPDKPGKAYLDNVTRDRLPKNIPPPEQLTETGKYKLRMAEFRKQSLRSSLKELHARKVTMDATVAARSAATQQERTRLIAQPQREDVRLTNVSIPSAMRPQTLHHLSAAEEKALYESRRAAHEARLAAKHEERLDKLHTLYIHARGFITDKETLATAIDQAFTTTESLWRIEGRPEAVEEMIKRGRDRTAAQGRGGVMLAGDVNERALRDQERMKKIAERLSGGKL